MNETVQSRVQQLENLTKEFEYEIKAINKTLHEISITLSEIKVLNANIVTVTQDITLMKRNQELMEDQIKKLFDYHDVTVKELHNITKNETRSELKIGIGERLVWLVISAAVAAWGIFGGNK